MKNKILLVFGILFGLLMLNAGLDKLFHYMPPPEPGQMPQAGLDLIENFKQALWLMPLIGTVEIIGGILFIIPKTRALGAIVILPITVGILLTNIVQVPSTLIIAVIVLAINLYVIYDNREKYLPMIR